MKIVAFPVKVKNTGSGLRVHLNTGHVWFLGLYEDRLHRVMKALRKAGYKHINTTNYKELGRWLMNVRPALEFEYSLLMPFGQFYDIEFVDVPALSEGF